MGISYCWKPEKLKILEEAIVVIDFSKARPNLLKNGNARVFNAGDRNSEVLSLLDENEKATLKWFYFLRLTEEEEQNWIPNVEAFLEIDYPV